MKVQKLNFFHSLLLILLLTSCASEYKQVHLFGASKDTLSSNLAVIDWGKTYTHLMNGVSIKLTGRSETEFSTARKISIPPGDYIIYVGWLGVVSEYRQGNVTIRNSVTHSVSITAKPGMKYTLERVGYGKSEKISINETALVTR